MPCAQRSLTIWPPWKGGGRAKLDRCSLGLAQLSDISVRRQLNNAVNDARTMKKALERLNFEVNIDENLDRNQFVEKLSDFSAAAATGRHRVLLQCRPWGEIGRGQMIYAVFMVLVLLTLVASWRRHVLELTLFCITVVCVLAYLIADMTTPLTLSF